MTTRNTKRALAASLLSLLLCVAMLVGTTFAWFTDSVKSGANKIVAGNLDIELYRGADEKVTGETKLFAPDGFQWEPGAVLYENFTVKNEGSLALKYEFSLLVNSYNTVADSDKSLLDVLKVAVVRDGTPIAGREDIEGLTFAPLAEFTESGSLAAAESDTYSVVIYWEPSAADDDYNLKNDAAAEALFVELGVNLEAAQATLESDGFDDQYDKDASFPVKPWDGSTKTEPKAVEGVYQIKTADELAWVLDPANIANSEAVLTKDIDLGGKEWPVASNSGNFVFDGQNHAIRNFTMSTTGQAGTGLFGAKGIRNATVKNLTVENAVAEGNEYTGILFGMTYACTIENVTLKNVEAKGFKWVGGIAGYAAENTSMKDITVADSSFALDRGSALDRSKVGTVAGAWQTSANATATAENITVTNSQVSGGIKGKGMLIGTYDGRGVATMTNCHATDVTGSTYLVGEVYFGNGYGAADMVTLIAENCDESVVNAAGQAHLQVAD